MELIQTDAITQLTSNEFQEVIYVRGLQITLTAPENWEINGLVKATWRTLKVIAHSIMVHTQALYEYIHSSLMYTTHYMFTVLPIKHLINQDGEPTTPHKM